MADVYSLRGRMDDPPDMTDTDERLLAAAATGDVAGIRAAIAAGRERQRAGRRRTDRLLIATAGATAGGVRAS